MNAAGLRPMWSVGKGGHRWLRPDGPGAGAAAAAGAGARGAPGGDGWLLARPVPAAAPCTSITGPHFHHGANLHTAFGLELHLGAGS